MADPLHLDLSLEHRALAAGGRRSTHLVLRLTGDVKSAVDGERPRLRIVFVLDTSGSMQGPPIEAVARSVAELVALLRDEDEVGVVGFASDAAIVAAVAPLRGPHRVTVERRVHRLVAQGGTNVEAGLHKGLEALGPREAHTRHALVLLSDGQPNGGLTAPDALRALASSFRPDVSVSSLGYGAHHAEEVLAAIAEGGAGEYHFVPAPESAADTFARVLGAQGDVVADAIEALIRPAEGVEVEGFLGGVASRVTSAGLRAALPDLRAGVSKVFVAPLEVEVPKGPGAQPLASVLLRFRAAGASERQERAVELSVGREPAAALHLPAHHAVLLARAERCRAEARAMADRGAYEGAAAHLRAMIATIEAAPGYVANDGSLLSEALEQLIDEAIVLEQRPSAEQYRSYKREWMGMDMQSGGAHAGDHLAVSAQGIALRSRGGAAHLPPARLVGTIAGKGGGEGGGEGGAPIEVRLHREVTIGRTLGNDLPIPLGSLSKRHARVVPSPQGYVLVDLRSTNGTFLNGERITGPRVLRPGDRITLGDAHLTLELLAPDAEP